MVPPLRLPLALRLREEAEHIPGLAQCEDLHGFQVSVVGFWFLIER